MTRRLLQAGYERALTVGDLVDALEGASLDRVVVVRDHYGDYQPFTTTTPPRLEHDTAGHPVLVLDAPAIGEAPE